MIDEQRAINAYSDVLAVEWDEQAGVMRIVTLGDVYTAIPSEGLHMCPDRKHNLGGDGHCKHTVAADSTRGRLDVPTGWLVTDDLDTRTDDATETTSDGRVVATDGSGNAGDWESEKVFLAMGIENGPAGLHETPRRAFEEKKQAKDFLEYETYGGRVMRIELERSSTSSTGTDVRTDGGTDGQWVVRDTDSGNEREFDSRSEAEDAIDELEDLDMNVELVPPTETDGGATPAEVVDESDALEEMATVDPENYDLPERSLSDDPLTWIPGEFVDEIDGSAAINRKGFEVLAHFYEIDVESDLEVAPEETDFTHCRAKATATTPDGRRCEAYGSAHVERGDDACLLLEMADTRARKRALSIATGVGAVAVEELKNEVDR